MQKDINISIKQKLQQYAESKNFAVSYANLAFSETNGTYLDLHVLPATTVSPDLNCSMLTYKGICQINVNVKAGEGEEFALDIANEVINLFAYSSYLDVNGYKLYVISVPSISKIQQTSSSYTVPVSFMYKLDKF